MSIDPTHLGALQTGYEQGHSDAVLDLRVALREHGIDPETIEAVVTDRYANPFEALFDDRREYVRQEVRETFGSVTDEDGDDLFDQTDLVDAILDAHADWLTGHAAPVGTPDDVRALITTATAVVRELRGGGPPPHTDEPADIIDRLIAAVVAVTTSDCCDADPCILPPGHDGECKR